MNAMHVPGGPEITRRILADELQKNVVAAPPEVRLEWSQRFLSLLRLQSKANGLLVQRDADRRHVAARRLMAEAEAMTACGFIYGQTVRDVAHRVAQGVSPL